MTTIGSIPPWTDPDIAQTPGGESPLLCSIIIPVYNGAGVLARALDAVAAQTLAPTAYEIILVDDGSTDDTMQVVRNWQAIHAEYALRVISQPNRGQGAARNHGARLAQAPILLFTDADCAPVPGWASSFLEAMRGPAKPDAAMGAYISTHRGAAGRFAQLEFEERYARMAQHGMIDLVATYSAAYRRAVFAASGGFDETLVENEDVELSYRLSKTGKHMVFVPQAQVWHVHDVSWADYAETKCGRGYWRTVVYRRYPGKMGRDSYTPQILKLQVLLAPFAALSLIGALSARPPRRLGPVFLFLLTTLPMLRFALKRHSNATRWVPVGSLIRALAFGMGIGRALLEGVTGKQPAGVTQRLEGRKEAA